LDVLIGRVRRKIGGDRIVTERGKGFRLVDLP
jgi:DNA-binding response OmpR family regulator